MADEVADGFPQTVDGALGGFSEKSFQFGEGLLDWIEVWTVGRQEHQLGAGIFDQHSGGGALVTGQVVHDHNVTRLERWHDDLVDVGLKPTAVDGAVQDHRRHHTAQAQPRNKCRCFAVPMGKAHAQALPFLASAVRARHVRRRPGFVDKDQSFRVQIELVRKPATATLQYVRTVLLYGMASLFLRVWSWRTKNRCSADWLTTTPIRATASRKSARVASRFSASQSNIGPA